MDQESLPALVSRYVQLKANGKGFVGKCVFHADDGESLRVDEKSWRCLQCGAHDGQADAAGWLMAWSQCSRAEAEHQLSNGGLPDVIPIQVPALRKLPFWGDWALHKYPEARVWIHDSGESGVHGGRDYYPDRVHLGLITGAPLDDVSQLTEPKRRECILLPRNVESSMERMDALAAALYAAGHAKVKWIDPRSQEDNWSWPLGMGKDEAVAFAKKHVLTYPAPAPEKGGTYDGLLESDQRSSRSANAVTGAAHPLNAPINAASQEPGALGVITGDSLHPATAAPSNAAPDLAPVSPSSSRGLDRGAASDTPERAQSVSAPSAQYASETPPIGQPAPKRGNGQAGPAQGPITPAERAASYLANSRAQALSQLVYTCIADVRPEAVRWLWPGRIPLGELTMIVGDPGLGKSQICASLASVVTNGGQWPVDRTRAEQGSVLILSAEDNIKHTIRPRLDAAHADVSRCHSLQAVKRNTDQGTPYEASFNLAEDLAKLSVLMHELRDVKLVIIDPVSAYLGETDSHKNAEVRGMLAPLTTLAGNHNAAIILVSHLTKSQSANALMRVQGSIAFSALCRAVWGVTADKEDHQRRLFMPLKNNLGQDKTGLAYSIESTELESPGEDGEPIPTSRISWESQLVETSVEEAFGAALSHEERSEMDDAKEFLRDALAQGRVKSAEIHSAATRAGHKSTTIGRAKRALGVVSIPEGFAKNRVWFWELKAASQEEQPPRWDDPR